MSCEIVRRIRGGSTESGPDSRGTPHCFRLGEEGREHGRNCCTFGVHHVLFVTKTLCHERRCIYRERGWAVAATNCGNVRGSQSCSGLFSLNCQESGKGPRGFGGRMADALASWFEASQKCAFWMEGTVVWPYWFDIEPKPVADEVNNLARVALLPIISNITTQEHRLVFADVLCRDCFLGNVHLIAVSALRRTGFFPRDTGGWDTHNNKENTNHFPVRRDARNVGRLRRRNKMHKLSPVRPCVGSCPNTNFRRSPQRACREHELVYGGWLRVWYESV